MIRPRFQLLLAAATLAALAPGSASAQRQPPSPEDRLQRLEKQVEQVQRRVFPNGRPADSAGFRDDPAASQSSVIALDQRLDSLERQMRDMLRQLEENNNLLRTQQSDQARAQSALGSRLDAIEQRLAQGASTDPASSSQVETSAAKPSPGNEQRSIQPSASLPATSAGGAGSAAASDPGEDAYSEGFRLWEQGRYDEAINSLRAFTKAYPRHRRVSFANNLVGRALLDKGEPRAAAQALLANYRGDPRGERAPDSLYYLGQSLTRLGQTSQACKAYAELEAVYGPNVRADLAKLVDAAQQDAKC